MGDKGYLQRAGCVGQANQVRGLIRVFALNSTIPAGGSTLVRKIMQLSFNAASQPNQALRSEADNMLREK